MKSCLLTLLYHLRYWRYVNTPMFVINSQWNQRDFERVTCNVTTDDEDYTAYRSAWKQGITSLIEAMSIDQPANGWFIPNCQDETLFFSAQAIEVRKNLQVPLFLSGEDKNIFQVLNNWLTKSFTEEDYQAIDQFGPANPGKYIIEDVSIFLIWSKVMDSMFL